ncbi:hypothetical protein [Neobacillus terrae]|uniref:hypothetical protein n=1 Tax=Neobacillus terrae TaxID=3034837 RepID=UPI00140BE453|nr:hypothetical protein [Neobacillus terrae]NHM30973.1 hypothetical protein [Neobacillus terrae]
MEENIVALAEGIYNPKTKEYFEEVLSSYKHGNYRSAVVMLYTVVICDLVFKLNDLNDIHKDEKAKKILEDLKVEREGDPVSLAWENELIEKAYREANLLENDIYIHITNLKMFRNLSGHPLLNSLEFLYRPSQELARSLIIYVLEGLLIKHPLLTKNVFDPFMSDMERIKNEFPTAERLESYLDSRFFNYFNKENVEYIFSHLWKLVFKNNGEKEKSNRDIHFNVLLIMYKKYEEILIQFIKKNSVHFSDFLDGNSRILNKFIDFLSKYPDTYPLLKQHTQELLSKRVSSKKELFIKSYFLSDSIKEHLKKLDREFNTTGGYYNQPFSHNHLIEKKNVQFLYNLCEKYDALPEFYDLLIAHYCHSGSFDTADRLFDYCITPYFESFSKDQMESLMEKANSNPQCYNENGKSRHRILLETAKKLLGEEIEEKYTNIF